MSFRTVIATKDSAAWIDMLLTAYREQFKIDPLFVIDERSTDRTVEILRDLRADFILFAPSSNIVEAGMIEAGASAASQNWILRLDDDEFPSAALIEWAKSKGQRTLNRAWYLSRRELYKRDGEVVYSRSSCRYPHPERLDFLGPHVRFFHKDRVTFTREMHTSGLSDLTYTGFAPSDAFFVHCSALLRSQRERLEKIRSYERLQENSSWGLADEYLPELYNDDHHRPARDGLAQFLPLTRKLLATRESGSIELGALEKRLSEIGMAEMIRNISLHQRERAKLAKLSSRVGVSCDGFAWLRLVPRLWRREVAKMLLSMRVEPFVGKGTEIWNYLSNCDQKP